MDWRDFCLPLIPTILYVGIYQQYEPDSPAEPESSNQLITFLTALWPYIYHYIIWSVVCYILDRILSIPTVENLLWYWINRLTRALLGLTLEEMQS